MNERLKAARIKKGWSQEDAADAAQVAPRTYQRWESGETHPNFESRRLLRKAFAATDEELGLDFTSVMKDYREDEKQIVRSKSENRVISSESNIIATTTERERFVPFSLVLALEMEQIDDWPTWFALQQTQILTIINSWNGRALFCDELQNLVDQQIRMFDEMKPQDNDEIYTVSRRQSVIAIAALPLALLSSIQDAASASIVEELLSRCAASITACWHLLKGSELSIVDRTLSGYLPTLIHLAQHPSRYQKAAARLVTQGYRLKGIVALHQNNVKTREKCCQRALYYSEIAADSSLLVAALISLASTSYYDKNPVKATSIYQKAFLHLNKIPSLQRARLSSELAVVYAQQGQEQEALHFMELAQNAYPEHPENDSSFLYAEFTPASMILEEGLTHLALAQHYPDRMYGKYAWSTFARIEEPQRQASIPKRIFFEITNQQAETALVLGDQDLFRAYLEKGIQGAKALHSKQRRREAVEIYRKAQSIWPNEPCIREMADLFL